MIKEGDRCCPTCGGELVGYDHVNRTVKTKNGEKRKIRIRRLRCRSCGKLHRELPDILLPGKQYEADVIFGVQQGLIDSDTLGYEDYPCEMTMTRWRSQNLHKVL